MRMADPLSEPASRWPESQRRTAGRSGDGFTLVELLVGVALSAVVLGALGGALLVSQMKVTAAIRRDLDRRDALNRAVSLMRSEISRASRISISTVAGLSSDLCSAPSLRLSSPGSQDICYKVSTSALAITNGYGSGTDRPWSGSCLLLRQGPRYNPSTGELDATSVVGPLRQVILDDLTSCSGTPSALTMAISSNGSNASAISRDVDITIRQASGAVTSFSARTGSNVHYAGNDMTVSNICADGVCHWKPDLTGQAPTTSSQNKNIFYFPNRQETYQLSSCSYERCTISSGSSSQSLSNVDVLVFADQEVRP